MSQSGSHNTPLPNPETEQSVLGAILVWPEVLDRIADLIAPEDFYREAHGRIYQVMLDLYGRSEPVDLVTVNALLKERGQLEGVGGPVFLAGLSEQVGFATNGEFYAHLVREQSTIRKIIDFGQELSDLGRKPGTPSKDLLQFIESRQHDLSSRNGFKDNAFDLRALTPISEWLKSPPPPRDYLFKGVLPAGIVGAVVAIGGTGKGYLLNFIGLSLATGLKVGPLEPTKKFKVVYLAAEDDQDELKRRTISTMKEVWPGEPPPEVDNFIPISVFGKLGPLMQLDMAKNPVSAPAYDWLCRTLENLKDIEVVILDPKSMLYGLVENDNDHNSAWIKCLASIARRFKITIIFAHHESKARAGTQDQASSRGGGALTDGCRWVANIRTMDPKTAEKFQVADPHKFVEMDVTKSNYAPKLPGPVYFRRGTGGALAYVDLAAKRVQELARKLVRLLDSEDEPFSRNDLIYEKRGKVIADALKEAVQGFNRIKDINHAVDFAIESEWLLEIHKKGNKGRGKSILRVTEMGRL